MGGSRSSSLKGNLVTLKTEGGVVLVLFSHEHQVTEKELLES
jgi:hypothetical protein